MIMAAENSNLTPTEKQIVQELLGDSKEALYIGIAEFLVSSCSSEEKWDSLVNPGVVCFVEDLFKCKFFLQVISMTKGKIVWSQNIDEHIATQRRRRWIFVFETGYRKLMLNFVDDDEADVFSNVLFNRVPELEKKQINESTIRYTITGPGKVEFEHNIDRNRKRKRNMEKIVELAKLPKSVLNAEEIRETVEKVYGDLEIYYGSYTSDIFGIYEDDLDIFGNYDAYEGGYGLSEELSSETTTPSPLFRKSESWPNQPDPISEKTEKLSSRIASSPPAPSPPPKNVTKGQAFKPSSRLPPPPPNITLLPVHTKPENSSGLKTKESLQDQIRSRISLRNVETAPRSGGSNDATRTQGDRGIPDALMDAINKIRMATMNSELYGGIDSDDNIYGGW